MKFYSPKSDLEKVLHVVLNSYRRIRKHIFDEGNFMDGSLRDELGLVFLYSSSIGLFLADSGSVLGILSVKRLP